LGENSLDAATKGGTSLAKNSLDASPNSDPLSPPGIQLPSQDHHKE
jgi:hypothetical protein